MFVARKSVEVSPRTPGLVEIDMSPQECRRGRHECLGHSAGRRVGSISPGERNLRMTSGVRSLGGAATSLACLTAAVAGLNGAGTWIWVWALRRATQEFFGTAPLQSRLGSGWLAGICGPRGGIFSEAAGTENKRLDGKSRINLACLTAGVGGLNAGATGVRRALVPSVELRSPQKLKHVQLGTARAVESNVETLGVGVRASQIGIRATRGTRSGS